MSATISPLPPAAQPTDDRSTFNTKEFAHRAALPQFVDEANALAAEVEGNAIASAEDRALAQTALADAEAARDSAASAAAAAAASAAASLWVSGTTYTAGQRVVSTLNGGLYRRIATGAGTTDPRDDPTNWAWAGAWLLPVPVTASTHTVADGTRAVLRGALQQTISPPPSPQPGYRFAFKVANGRSDALISWGSQKHEGLSDATTTLEAAGLAGEWVYIDNSYGWCLV